MSTPYRVSSAVDVAAPFLARVRRLARWAPLAYVSTGICLGFAAALAAHPAAGVAALAAGAALSCAWHAALGRVQRDAHALRDLGMADAQPAPRKPPRKSPRKSPPAPSAPAQRCGAWDWTPAALAVGVGLVGLLCVALRESRPLLPANPSPTPPNPLPRETH